MVLLPQKGIVTIVNRQDIPVTVKTTINSIAEFSLAAGEEVEHHWDLGYRGLIPRALARFLGSRTSDQAQPEAPIPDATYHRVLRRHERARRSALARRLLPDLAADERLPMDIFGDDLASSDSDQEVPQPPPQRSERTSASPAVSD